jgi:sulfonate transport system ATP-binding protein
MHGFDTFAFLSPDSRQSEREGGGGPSVAASEGGTHLTLRGVSKGFGGRTVLKPLDLDIEAGSFVSIVGRSGGGKSTMLRLISGLTAPDTGVILHNGKALVGLASRTTMMFQDARLLPWQRVLSNVGIARGPGWEQRSHEALRAVGLDDREREWPAVLSGGQKQRVALARALVARPHLLLLDEPLGALDALTRGEMQRLIERLWLRHGFTAILVTHDVAEAVALSDRVLILQDGTIALDLRIDLPRPRRRTASEVNGLESRILDLLQS